jgi:hypothetical protein
MVHRRHHVHVNEAAGLCRATGTPARPSRYFIDGALSLLTVAWPHSHSFDGLDGPALAQ